NDGKVTGVEEKPRRPKQDLSNAGIYILDEASFPLIEKTPKSPRGEYEITDTIRSLIETRDVYGFRLPGEWIDVGRPWDLLRANAALLAPLKGANHADVDGGATLVGEVLVEAGARVRRGAYIEGPTVIGLDSEVGPNCYIRPGQHHRGGIVTRAGLSPAREQRASRSDCLRCGSEDCPGLAVVPPASGRRREPRALSLPGTRGPRAPSDRGDVTP